MTQSPVTVTYSLEDVLARIENKIDDVKADGIKRSERIENKIDDVKADVEDKIDDVKADVVKLSERMEEKIDGVKADVVKLSERMEEKIDGVKADVVKLSEQLKNVEVGLAEVKTEVKGMTEDIKEIKGSQKAQIWTLIGVLGTAVVGTVIRFVITALPGNPQSMAGYAKATSSRVGDLF